MSMESGIGMVLYFTGTGNSRYIAKRVADALGDKLLSMNDRIKAADTSPIIEYGKKSVGKPRYHFEEDEPCKQ